MSARSQNRNPRTGRRGVFVTALGALLAGTLIAGASQPSAQGDAPPPGALENLEKMEDKILRAKAESDRGNVDRMEQLTFRATTMKFDFVREAFKGRDLHGCSAAELIINMDLLDAELAKAIAANGDEEREKWLNGAFSGSLTLTRKTENCAPSGPRAIVDEIRERTERLRDQHGKGKLSSDELRAGARQVSVLKRELLVGQRIYNCEVLTFFVLIERIDQTIDAAEALPEKKDERRGSLLRKAAKGAAELIERWRQVPCGGVTPPPPGEFTVEDRLSWYHVNGFGTPPTRECNFISTSPAQPGAQVTDVITRPSPQSQVTKTATTDGNGAAVVSMDIDQTGTYTHQTTVTSQGGVQATDTESQTVTSANTGDNGQCPAPTP